MEGSLTARDRVGIQDFVLLDAYTSESAVLDNLRKRFNENLIYTYIGTLLVSVNPYKELGIYTKKQMDIYMGVNFFELPPHIYALADNVYRTMLTETNNHFILISGESGAGKTEASKKILQFYAVSCPSTKLLDNVRDRLLLSNPVLEAFGNAKTLKNDNSSRFGKYMDIQFDHMGGAVGGHILSYLLEKSRVVHQNHGERSFHIFYQLVEGGEEDLLRWLGLERNCQRYSYLVQVGEGECAKVSSVNDKSDWKTVRKALSVIEFSESNIESLFAIIASVLHLGNVTFVADSQGYATLNNSPEIHWLSKLLGIPAQVIQVGLTHRKIEARSEEVLSPFTVDQAVYAKDALAKAIYGRTFTWLVNELNESLANKDSSRKTVIGLLDIYGFEVFSVNSFEQFCINYCNEKLQQLFIQLTLKSEQEEYEMEGIEWESVPYFNNKIICDLVEAKFKGIISVLDEECLRPGEATDMTFLEKLEEKMGGHAHFVTHKLADQKTRKTLERGDFRLLHYAGEVTYSVVGFLDKNNDLLYRNIKEVATQFKSSLVGLTEILMSKEPWYVRCMKPNEGKQPGLFDDVLVRHQVKYLGLMEHLRVRRAGFAYRRRYEIFLQRYKPLCPDTWPNWKGTAAEGVECLVKHLGYKPDEYKMGRTKIFIRHPRTLFATEDAFEVCKHELATRIQAKYKGYRVKGDYMRQRQAATKIETCWRGMKARREREKRAWAVKVIKRFIKGFMTRNQPACVDNTEYLAFVRQNYLTRLKENLPKTVVDKNTWLTPPPIMQEASQMLRKLYTRHMVRRYVQGIMTERKAQLQIKGLTSSIFKGTKENYPHSVGIPFVDTRISEEDIHIKVYQMIRQERIKYSVPVVKYDRNGFRPRFRQLIYTGSAAYLVEEAKIKQRVEFNNLKGVSVSTLSDNFLILHVQCEDIKQKGDLVLQCDYLFEALTKLCLVANKHNFIKVVQGSVKFDIQPGREGFVDFKSGQETMIYRAKNGHLMVESTRTKSRAMIQN
ncbi:unconventional myosin-Ih isoform X3 [Oncorhynchus clarkii lewisi]|uniref:unconventional myosin-Ih isoform X3 n=1 Tax=Oncorhynchus clarkii lewisi TaxID=490388 RepID=UPI0039B9A8F2